MSIRPAGYGAESNNIFITAIKVLGMLQNRFKVNVNRIESVLLEIREKLRLENDVDNVDGKKVSRVV